MSSSDGSLTIILDKILSGYVNSGEIVDSTLKGENKETSEIASQSATVLLKQLKGIIPEKVEASKGIEKEFEAAVYRTWKKPLDLLDLLLYLSLEIDSEFNSFNGSDNSSKRYVREALVGQQANACLVFNEIVHLLKSGFPSGANSHWRTLHEIACVSYFISKHGEDMAKRFLDYKIVETNFQAQAICKHQQKMEGETPLEKNIKKLTKKVDKLRKLYGSDFVNKANYPYGWIPRTVIRTRSLREIEKSVKLDMLRHYYDIASHNVIGGPNGLIFKPGFMKKETPEDFPVGPSNYGLSDPGKSAAISLGQVMACLLLSEFSFKNMVIIEALRSLVDDICDAFNEIQSEFGKNSMC